jgi:outer membrane biosynthesis protein TonB
VAGLTTFHGGAKLKVKLLPNVSSYLFDGRDYKPGDIFEIKPCMFRADFMQSLEPIVTSEPESEVVEETVPAQPEPAEKPEVKPVAKKKSTKKAKKQKAEVEEASETSETESTVGSETEAS